MKESKEPLAVVAPTVKPSRPNKEEYQKSMEDFTEKINSIREEILKVQAKLPAKDSNSALSKDKETFKQLFDTLLNQKKDLQKKKKAMFDEVGNLRTLIKKKSDEARNARDKLPFKSTAEIDANVAEHEGLLKRGGLSLQEEKKIVAEISSMKKARKGLESLASQPAGIESDKAKIDLLKTQMDAIEIEIKEVDPKVTAAKEKLVAVEKDLKSSYGSISSLLDAKKDLSAKFNAAKEEKNALYQSFKASQDAWYAWERDEKKRKFEAEKLERAAEREARLVAQAEQELEDAGITAFQNEIAVCEALIKYFKSQSPQTHEDVAPVVDSDAAARVESSMPARATLVTRKEDRDEDFMVLGNKKSKSKKRAQPTNAKPLRMDLELIDQLSKLSISIPKTTVDVPAVIEALETKKLYFKENSESQTKANKEAVLEKIKKLRAAEAAPSAEE